MTIHHDKMAYGRLARSNEQLSEDKIAEMLQKLRQEEGEEGLKQPTPEENPHPVDGARTGLSEQAERAEDNR